MKLVYEQLRLLSEIGDAHSKITIKNKKGHVLRPTIKKWGSKETKSMSTPELLKPLPPLTASHSVTSRKS
jgi:hypothetical protein